MRGTLLLTSCNLISFTSWFIVMNGTAKSLPYAVNALPFLGRVIAVTGASRGLGLAVSKYLLIRGATVSMCVSNVSVLHTCETYADFAHQTLGNVG